VELRCGWINKSPTDGEHMWVLRAWLILLVLARKCAADGRHLHEGKFLSEWSLMDLPPLLAQSVPHCGEGWRTDLRSEWGVECGASRKVGVIRHHFDTNWPLPCGSDAYWWRWHEWLSFLQVSAWLHMWTGTIGRLYGIFGPESSRFSPICLFSTTCDMGTTLKPKPSCLLFAGWNVSSQLHCGYWQTATLEEVSSTHGLFVWLMAGAKRITIESDRWPVMTVSWEWEWDCFWGWVKVTLGTRWPNQSVWWGKEVVRVADSTTLAVDWGGLAKQTAINRSTILCDTEIIRGRSCCTLYSAAEQWGSGWK